MTAPASLEDAATEGRVIAWFAVSEPDRPAVVAERGTLTFAELDARINRLVRALRARGIAAGDAIALAAPNRAEWVETFAAAQRAGLRITPINWHLGRDEAEYIVRDCGARAVVVDGALGVLAAAAADAPVRLVIGPATGDGWSGWEDYETALAAEAPDPIDDPVRGSIMLYTSGTTGRPKGVSRPPEDPATALTAARFSGYAPGMVHLVTGPLYHTAPLLLSMNTPLHGGATLVLMEQWDAAETLRLVEEHRVTHTHMVPTMFHRLLALPDDTRAAADTSSFLAVIHGAAPCPVHVKERLIAWLGPVVWEYYGATEGAATLVDSHTWLTKPGTVGRPDPRDHVKVGDEDGTPLPVGTPGLVWIRSKPEDRFVYHGDPAKTEGAYRGEYFTLGDVGYLDEDGYLFLTDRSAHLIVSGGVNIYPAEVDAVLLEHPAVADAATIGVPDDEWGESVLAVVEVRDGVTADAALADELIAFCRTKLAAFKCPRAVDFVATLPRQDNGKVAKTKLRDEYRARHTPSRRDEDAGSRTAPT